MNTALLLSVLLGGVDSLANVSFNGLTVKAPTEWQKAEEENSRSWAAPGGEGELALSVFPVDPQRPARACVDQLVAALTGSAAPDSTKDGGVPPGAAPKGFNPLMLGAQPAAKNVTTDYVGEGEAAKKDENKVTTTTVVGCNGRTKWVLTYSSKTRSATRFGPILKRVLDSIAYGK